MSFDEPHDEPFPIEGRIAGVDYGTVRIGVSITDPNRLLSSPLFNYTRGSLEQDSEFFVRICHDEGIQGWVVGLPVHTNGEESQKSYEAREFGRWLRSLTQLPVCFFDERFTSKEAESILASVGATRKKKKRHTDSIAAQLLLQAFLEAEPGAANQRPKPLD